jgi:hypothetical protein
LALAPKILGTFALKIENVPHNRQNNPVMRDVNKRVVPPSFAARKIHAASTK